jgi:holo-[acyl-carrier protein] synthase
VILGVGVDLVSVERIERAYRRRPARFLARVFTAAEVSLLEGRRPLGPVLAARFAAKEAVLKALGCGIGPAGLREVEVLAPRGRQPRVALHGHAARLAAERGIAAVELSFSHEPPFACACALALGRLAPPQAEDEQGH